MESKTMETEMLKKVVPEIKGNPNKAVRMVLPQVVETNDRMDNSDKTTSESLMLKMLANSTFFGLEYSGYSFEKIGSWLKPRETASYRELSDYVLQIYRKLDFGFEFSIKGSKAIERRLKLLFKDEQSLAKIGLKRVDQNDSIDYAWFVKL